MNIVSLAESLGRLSPGQSVFVPGASGAPSAWMDALLADGTLSRGLSITTTYVPGINTLTLDTLHETATVSGLFMQPGLADAQARGVYRHLPLSYAGFLRHIGDIPPFDVAVVQVAPPDAAGMCSFGPSVEFNAAVLARATRRVGVINARTPRMVGAQAVAVGVFTECLESDTTLPVYATGRGDDVANAIAAHIAPYIADGMTLQIGLGKVPDAVLSSLADRQNLKFHSGMLSDGVMHLYECGALAPDHVHVACALVGSRVFYDWAAGVPVIGVRGCELTHAPGRLSALTRFVAINSALEVDLLGQCNLEFLGRRAVSGPGGAPDFAAAAKRCPGGLSIIALPAMSQGVSRIRPRLAADTVCSLPRTDIDIVVTEHGAADLRGGSVNERAERLISIAAPSARAELNAEWRRA